MGLENVEQVSFDVMVIEDHKCMLCAALAPGGGGRLASTNPWAYTHVLEYEALHFISIRKASNMDRRAIHSL